MTISNELKTILEKSPTVTYTHEPGNKNNIISGSIDSNIEDDYIKVVIDKKREYQIRIIGGRYGRIEIFDKDLNPIDKMEARYVGTEHAKDNYSFTNGINGNDGYQLTTTLDKGTYYLKYSRLWGTTGDYSVTVLGDTTSPNLQNSTPRNTDKNINPRTQIELSFDEVIVSNKGKLILYNKNIEQSIEIAIDDESQITFEQKKIIIKPKQELNENTTYYIHLEPGSVQDITGNKIQNSTEFSFTTGVNREVGPKLISARTLSNDEGIVLSFDDYIDPKSINIKDLFDISINGKSSEINSISYLEKNIVIDHNKSIFYEDTKGNLNNTVKGYLESTGPGYSTDEDLIKLVIDEKKDYNIHLLAGRGLVEILDDNKNLISTIDFKKAWSDRSTNEYYKGLYGTHEYNGTYLQQYYQKSGHSAYKTEELDKGTYYLNVKIPDYYSLDYEIYVSSDNAKEQTSKYKNNKEILLSYSDPTSENDIVAIQDLVGNDSLSLNKITVNDYRDSIINASNIKTINLPLTKGSKGEKIESSLTDLTTPAIFKFDYYQQAEEEFEVFLKTPEYSGHNLSDLYDIHILDESGKLIKSPVNLIYNSRREEKYINPITENDFSPTLKLSKEEGRRSTIHTFSTENSTTWEIIGGDDKVWFNINSSGELGYWPTLDYEDPKDKDKDNRYLIELQSTDGSGNKSI